MAMKTKDQTVTTIEVPGSSSFSFKEKFPVLWLTTVDGIMIGHLTGFAEYLLDRIEPEVPEARLKLKEVKRLKVWDLPEISFTHFWNLFRPQGRCQVGILATDEDHQTIARIRGNNDIPLLISAYWDYMINVEMGFARGWCFRALQIDKVDKRTLKLTRYPCTTVSY